MSTRLMTLKKLLIEQRGSSTTIGGSLGILIVYILWSQGVLNEPSLLIYSSVFVVFAALGGCADYYQSKIMEE